MPKFDRVLFIPLFLILGSLTALLSFSSARENLKNWLIPEKREIIAKAQGDLTGKGEFISVIKVKTRDELFAEVYSVDQKSNQTRLMAKLAIPERRDGYFEFRGQPTNLALADLNADGILEVIIPAFDDNLIPRLHVFRYDPVAQVFILTTAEELTKEFKPLVHQ